MIEIAVCDDVIGIRKCTAFVLRRGRRRATGGATVKFSRLDLASRQCVKIT